MRDGIDEYTLLCEDCGYVIEGIALEGQCPECGKPVTESLPGRRDSTPGVWGPLRRPLGVWKTLRIEASYDAGRRAAARCMIAGMLLCVAVAVGVVPWLLTHDNPATGAFFSGIALIGAIMAGSIAGLTLMILTWIETRGLRFFGARRGFRVTRDVADTVCSHACVGWLAGSIVWLIGWALIGASVLYEPLVSAGVLIALGGLLVGLLGFESLAYLGMRGCRFANRVGPVSASASDGSEQVEDDDDDNDDDEEEEEEEEATEARR